MSIDNIPTYYQGGTFDPSNIFNIYEGQQINNLNGPVSTQIYTVESTTAPLPNGNTKMVIYKVQKTGVVLDLSTFSGSADGQSITVFNDFSSNFPLTTTIRMALISIRPGSSAQFVFNGGQLYPVSISPQVVGQTFTVAAGYGFIDTGSNYISTNSILYSYDGYIWCKSNMPNDIQLIQSVYNNNGLWVANGFGEHVTSCFLYSYNGKDWIQGEQTSIVGFLSYWNGFWVCVGTANPTNSFATSEDGITWTEEQDPFGGNACQCISSNAVSIVAGFDNGSVYVISVLGDGWVEIVTPLQECNSIYASEGGTYVIGGVGTDGGPLYFVTLPVDFVTECTNNTPMNICYNVSFNGNQWVATGTDSTGLNFVIANSVDGETWNTSQLIEISGLFSSSELQWNSQTWILSLLDTPSDDNPDYISTLYYSSNGINWGSPIVVDVGVGSMSSFRAVTGGVG
jgi:hypothetical protein